MTVNHRGGDSLAVRLLGTGRNQLAQAAMVSLCEHVYWVGEE